MGWLLGLHWISASAHLIWGLLNCIYSYHLIVLYTWIKNIPTWTNMSHFCDETYNTILHPYRNVCVREIQEILWVYTQLWYFSHSGICTTVRIGWRVYLLKSYLFMVKWNKGFEELRQIIFRKEYLGKLNIMNLIYLKLFMQRYLYSSLKSQE